MNVKLLRKVKKHILEEPKRLLMNDWILRRTRHQKDIFVCRSAAGDDIRRPFAKCGTAACIAGWTCIISAQPINDAVASELLELDHDEAARLFLPGEWPHRFSAGLGRAGTRRVALAAAKRIEHFIKTKGKE